MCIKNRRDLILPEVKRLSIIALVKSITTANRIIHFRQCFRKDYRGFRADRPGLPNGARIHSDNRFFIISPMRKEFAFLSLRDIYRKRQIVFETDWDVIGHFLSENDKYRVIVINEDSRAVIRIMDTGTGEEVDYPEIPGTDIVNLNISDSEKLLMLTLGSSKTTGDIYVCEFGSSELKKLTSTLIRKYLKTLFFGSRKVYLV